ncbi:crinkler family protein: PROVISIONAL [Gigaspora margarita]|uniref:Crinkler family protein: PROVISIONAL n=1 Tax=Gigaspora margarita TaxID=4874 RepID=A0A8H4ADS6_GIGMA|nr:crinkler family protein: PROVISIONAL [Gigaspora margarita]
MSNKEIFRSNSEMSIENDVPSMHSILSNQNENNIKDKSILWNSTNITNNRVTCQKNDDNYQTEYDEDESDSNCSIAQQANNMEDKAMSNEQAIFQINDDSNEGSSSSIATSVERIVLPKHSSSKTNQLAKVIQEGNKTVMQRLNNIERLLKDQQKPEVIPISKLKRNDWNKIQLATGLKLEAIELTIEYEVKCDPFQWDDRPEREQKDRYLTHLRKLLQVSKYRKLEIYDASKNNNFLSMSADSLPTRLIGTTDIAIVDRVSISTRIPQNHI